jgi:tetratricopeptide (TPR) repeat protein
MWRPYLTAVGIAALALLTPKAAHASEAAGIAKAQGLIEFHHGNFAAALASFDQAHADDPADPYILYYRGVTRGRLLDLDGAIADLRAALTLKPDLDRAALELGVALVQTHAEAEAVRWLQQAQRSPELEGEASLYLGRAQFELGETDAARADWERAAHDPAQSAAVPR